MLFFVGAVLLSAIAGYLLGSINFAIIITKIFSKKDIRDFGSGNAGMTNVLRTLGKGPAALTLLGDLGKGILAVVLGNLFFQYIAGETTSLYGAYIGGFCALLGHIYPLYYRFKGGKGMLVSAGILLVIDPAICLICLGMFFLIVLLSRIVSLASIITAITYPIATLIMRILVQASAQRILWETVLSALIGCIIIFMHRDNIKRLMNGTEYKFGQKKK